MADQNILVRITGEADLTEAQVEMRELNERGKELEAEMARLVAAEKLQKDALSKMGTATAQARQKAEESLKTTQKQIREQQALINQNQKSIQSLSNAVSSYNAMNGAGGKLAAQIKVLREQMAQMEMAGDTSSQAFIDLGVQVAQLTDQIGDTQQQIRILASDTKNLDAAMSAGSGLVGGFNAVTSAMALFGGESDELQQAFLKVQAAMAALNGVQQVANTLNKDSAAMVVLRTAYSKVFAKQKAKEAAATAANTVATGAETAATGAATTAQWSLNAAMAANPIGAIITLVVAAVAALAALTVGVIKLVGAFSAEARASRAAKKAQEEYDKQTKATTYNLNLYGKEHEKTMQGIAKREQDELNEKRKNHASNAEIQQAELAYLKEREKATLEYQKKAVEANNKDQIKANEVYNAKLKQLNAVKKGTKKYYEVLEELTQAERQMNEVWKRGNEITQEYNNARQAVVEQEQKIADEQLALQKRLNASRINLMKEGQAKEIAQVKANYDEQLKEISGSSKEEKALRASLLAEQNKELQEIRRKYRLQEQSEQLDMLKNALAADENNVILKQTILEEEAELKIAQLDKDKMSEQAYANAVTSIRTQLSKDLKAIDDAEAARHAEVEQIKTQTAIQAAQERAKAEYSPEVYALQRDLLNQQAQAEIDAVNRSVATQEEKAERIKAIEEKLHADIVANKNAEAAEIAEIEHQKTENALTQREIEAQKVLGDIHAELDARRSAEAEMRAIRDARLADEEQALNEAYERGEMNYSEYQSELLEIERERLENAQNDINEHLERVKEGFNTALSTMSEWGNAIFDTMSGFIDNEIAKFEQMYTTDAEEAKKNKNKKLISEEEYNKKANALKKKQAQIEKVSAAFNIAIGTAQGIMQAIAQFGPPPSPMGIAGIAFATALGAAQLAMVLSKPLPQYAKGRKGGKGEYAMVGERGAEMMYIPEGASIVPHHHLNQPEKWKEYGVPMPSIPSLPNVDKEIMQYAIMAQLGLNMDYDRIGKAVADNIRIPEQKTVNVSIDRSGIGVSEGGDIHMHLNQKYFASWN